MDGKKVTIGNVAFHVPEATLDTAEAIALRLEELSASPPATAGRHIAAVIAIALRENYPQIDPGELARMIKLKDAARVLREVLTAAGMEQGTGAPGEAGTPQP